MLKLLVVALLVSLTPIAIAPTSEAIADVHTSSLKSGIYKYSSGSMEVAYFPGCVNNCSSYLTPFPQLSPQDSSAATFLSNASQIETNVDGPYPKPLITCGVISRELWCAGYNQEGQVGDESTTNRTNFVRATSSGVPLTDVSKVAVSSQSTCALTGGDLKCIGTHLYIAGQQPLWQVISTNVKNFSLSPSGNILCIITTQNVVKCANTNGARNGVGYQWSPVWVEFDSLNPTDVVAAYNDDQVCVAGTKSKCATLLNSQISNYRELVGADNAERIYGSLSSSVCTYSSGLVKCGQPTKNISSIRLKTIGAMTTPLAIIPGRSNGNLVLFLTESAIRYADYGTAVACDACSINEHALASINAFADSTATSFSYLTRVNAITDNADYLNLSVESGSRKMRSQVSYTIRTESGSPLVGTSIKWAAPDAPGLLASSKTSILSTSDGGLVRSTIPSGPVTFTLQYGLAPNGAELQATSLTMIIPESGSFTVVVPDPPAIVDRKISVVLPDNSVVPNALVKIRNNSVTYAYQSSNAGRSVWSATPKDNSGYMATLNCAYCDVTAPTYITGDDGSVTFRSFIPSVSSTLHDVDIVYDDGELRQLAQHRFTGTRDTVQMAFMAKINTTITDQNKSTPDIDVRASANGTVDIPVELKDEDNVGVSNFRASTESVCSIMDTGGLVSASQNIGGLCSSTANKASREVSAKSALTLPQLLVSKSSCSSKRTVQTNASGKAKLRLCVTKSTKVRIRGVGALGSKSFCIRVKNKPCPGSVPATNMGTRLIDVNAQPKLSSLFQISTKAKPTYSFSKNDGQCFKSKANQLSVRSSYKKEIKNNPMTYKCEITMILASNKMGPSQRKFITVVLG